eukprot:Rmarinus@m.23203
MARRFSLTHDEVAIVSDQLRRQHIETLENLRRIEREKEILEEEVIGLRKLVQDDDLRNAKSTIKKLRMELEKLEEVNLKWKKEHEIALADVHRARKRRDETQDMCDELREDNNKLRVRLLDADKAVSFCTREHKDFDDIKTALQSCRDDLRKIQTERDSGEHLQAAFDAKNEEMCRVLRQLAACENESSNLREEVERLVKEKETTEGECLRLTEENTKCTTRVYESEALVNELRAQKDDEEKKSAHLQRVVDELNHQARVLQEEVEHARARLEELERNYRQSPRPASGSTGGRRSSVNGPITGKYGGLTPRMTPFGEHVMLKREIATLRQRIEELESEHVRSKRVSSSALSIGPAPPSDPARKYHGGPLPPSAAGVPARRVRYNSHPTQVAVIGSSSGGTLMNGSAVRQASGSVTRLPHCR